MEQQPGQVPGSHFKVHAPGDSFMFSHPVSGITHTLTVQEIEQQTVPQIVLVLIAGFIRHIILP